MPYFFLVVLIVLLDQVSKYFVVQYLTKVETFPLWQDVFHLTYAENRGAAFSMLQNQRWFFISITIIAILVMIYILWKKRPKNLWLALALTSVLGGAIGNLIDRIRLGYVVDFFDFTLIKFAIFNVADSFVVVGAIGLCVALLFDAPKENKE